jgi:hypothetical protein
VASGHAALILLACSKGVALSSVEWMIRSGIPFWHSLRASSSGCTAQGSMPKWFQEFRREVSNRAFETVELLQEALGQALQPYWEEPARLRRLTGFSWWVETVDAL